MTRPWVLDHAPYTPFMDPRTAGPPGLMPLPPDQWIVTDPDRDAQMCHRRDLMDQAADVVFGILPEGEAPAAELASMVLAFTGATAAPSHDPLCQIGHAVADDFCLLLPDTASGEYRLVAAVLCFPSRWLLSEKLGRPLTDIHEPVPDYDETLARRVNRVFEALRVDRPLYRINWLVHQTAELHLPLGVSEKLMETAQTSEELYLRTERQTLIRLPDTAAIAFGIKTSVTPVQRLTPEQAAPLARQIRKQTDASIDYHAGAEVMASALTTLDRLAD